jgi:hypothetical protein
MNQSILLSMLVNAFSELASFGSSSWTAPFVLMITFEFAHLLNPPLITS